MKTIMAWTVIMAVFFFPRITKVIHLPAPQKMVPVASEDYDGILVFHATWCGPCKKMKTNAWDKITEEELGDKGLWRIDIDKRPEKAKSWQVKGVPTVVLYKWRPEDNTGKEIGRQVGYLNEEQLRKFLGIQKE